MGFWLHLDGRGRNCMPTLLCLRNTSLNGGHDQCYGPPALGQVLEPAAHMQLLSLRYLF
jgi:hypothetical protein